MEEETGTVKMVMSKKKTVKMVKMGVMVAISVAMVYLVHFPIFPAVPFLEYDPADISILIGTFAFGPEAGLVLTVVTAVVQGLTVSAGSGLYGILMHMIATGVLVLVSGMIYNRKKTKATAVFGLTAGMAAMAVVMVGRTGWHGRACKSRFLVLTLGLLRILRDACLRVQPNIPPDR